MTVFCVDMPAKTTLFDHRVKPLHDFGPAPHNYVSFNPHGRLIALGGFGNLAGQISIFDRRTLQKVSIISAAHTSYCSWSPDGRFLLTATLSPRLRVDNGIKIWHCSGPLMHVQLTDELFQVEWRPSLVEDVPPFGSTIPPAPTPCESVQRLLGAVAESSSNAKPAGAYRPPGARGLAAPAIFKREDEGGPSTPPRSGSNTPTRGHHANAGGNHGQDGGRRHVPGAPLQQVGKDDAGRKPKKKKTREDKEKKDRDKANLNGGAKPHVEINGLQPSEETSASVSAAPPINPDSPVLPATPDPIAKKMRNLNKKVSFQTLQLYLCPH
jgi:translation initiation factor 2A